MHRVLPFVPRACPTIADDHDYLLELAIATVTAVATYPDSIAMIVIIMFAQQELWRLEAEHQRHESRDTRDD